MKTTRFNPFRTAIIVLPLAFALSGGSEAAVRTKAATGTDLTAGASWDTLPGSGDVATWTGTSLGGALTIGSDLSWQGIDIQGATGAVTTSGAGVLTLGGSGVAIASGGVDADIQNSITIGADQNWTVGSGRILTVSKGKTLTLSNKLTLNGAGQVNLGGTGATTLTGTGEIVVSSGILQNNMQSGSSATGRSGATTLGGGTIAIATTISMFGTGAINLNSGAIGSFSGTGRDLGTANAVNIGGNVQIGGSSGGLGNGYVRFGGATDLGGSVRTLNVIASSVFTSNGAGAIFSGVISNGGITKDGAGILTITNNGNTISGATTINAGTFVINQKSIANSASVTLTTSGAALTITENGAGTHDINNLSGVAGTTIRSDFNIVGTAGARTLKVNQSTNGTFAGTFAEGTSGRTIALLKTGTAKLTLSGTGGYTGGTTISQGTLAAITNNGALGSSGTVTINDSNTGSNNTALLLGDITMARPITVANQGSGTTTLGANGGAAVPTFSGAITLAKDVTLDGTGSTDRLTFSGGIGGTGNVTIAGGTNRVVFATTANTYSGTTTVSTNSILQLGVGGSDTANHIPDASVVTVNSGGFLKLAKGANNETIGGLSGTGTVRGHEGVASTASALVISNSGNHSFGGVLEDGGASGSTLSVTKDGAGTQTLTNTNTYTGNTSVTNGKLIINGSISTSALTTVDSGASLGGSGTVGALTVNGTLAPGNSIESIGTGNLSFGSTATYAYELETAIYGTTPGVAGDLTYATGTLNIASGAILTLTDLASSTALANGSKLTLISYTGLWNNGLFTYLGNTLNDGASITLGANEWKFDYNDTVEGVNYTGDSTGSYVTMTVVPEPGAALLGGLGMLALLRRRRQA